MPENTIAKGAASANSGPSPTETAAECVTRCLATIDTAHPPATLTGDMVRRLTRDIRDACAELVADRDRLVGLLEEALVELQVVEG